MKFGVCLPNYGNNLSKKAVMDSARLAEQLGFHSVWTTDHVLVPKKHSDPYGNILDCLTTLAYIGALTRKIQLGTSVLVLPLRNPIVVAKQIATIDYLTGGRLILGTGVGWNEEEFQNLSTPYLNRGRRFEEAIPLLRVLYQNESPQFHGQFHKFTDATFKPKPRKNGPTIWFGGNSDIAIQRASKLADGWHPVGLPINAYRRGLRKSKPPFLKARSLRFRFEFMSTWTARPSRMRRQAENPDRSSAETRSKQWKQSRNTELLAYNIWSATSETSGSLSSRSK